MQVRFQTALHPDAPQYYQSVRIRTLHPWDVTAVEAVELQRRLTGDVITSGDLGDADGQVVRTVAGVDLSPPDGETGLVRGAAVVLSYPDLEVIEVETAEDVPGFPYVPGLLSFRESPVLIQALAKLRAPPDLLLVDGQGLAHPRRFGLACHLGLLADVPTVGVGKSRLVGTHGPVGEARGEWAPLVHRGEEIGAAVRTRTGVSPVFVSVGHRLSLRSAIAWVLACGGRYRVPEPTRLAHHAAAAR